MQVVYVIYSESQEAVKIGYTNNLNSRFSTIQLSNAEKLTLLMVLVGGKDLEKYLHEELWNYRISGEWFSCNEHLLSVLYKTQKDYINENAGALNEAQSCIIKIADDFLVNTKTRKRRKVPLSLLRGGLNQYPQITNRIIKDTMEKAGYTEGKEKNYSVYFTKPEYIPYAFKK